MGVFAKSVIFVVSSLTAAVVLSFVPLAHDIIPQLVPLQQAVLDSWSLLRPGGQWHPASFIEHQGHLFLEGFLIVVISYLLIQNSTKPSKKAMMPLKDAEIQELCDEWQPEPLHGKLSPFQQAWLAMEPLITTRAKNEVVVGSSLVLDMASLNFLGLTDEPAIREAAHATIRKYGVGSCGPRGFYGTLDVHLALEDRLAKFMGTQEAILYSYDLATMPSILPAFANRKDIIVVDDGVSYAVRSGCALSRARVLTFRHNDVADLERILRSVAAEDARHIRPLNRRFVVVEGIYANTGDVAPLAAIADLKNRYKYRLVVDESVGLGVLGRGGRGAAEAAGLAGDDVEIIGASLGNAIASVGGFCAGNREIVDHQRLSGLGYCFSASLPPYLASAASAAIDILEREGARRQKKVQANASRFRRSASTSLEGFLRVVGDADSEVSPLVHLQLHRSLPRDQWDDGDLALQRIVEDCLSKEGILFTVAKYSSLDDKLRPSPSLRVAISSAHDESDIEKAVEALAASCKRILPKTLII